MPAADFEDTSMPAFKEVFGQNATKQTDVGSISRKLSFEKQRKLVYLRRSQTMRTAEDEFAARKRKPCKLMNDKRIRSAVLLQGIQVLAAQQQNFCVPLVTVVSHIH